MILRPVSFPFRYAFSKIKKKIGKLDIIKIEPLYAFGNEEKIFFKGRVIESYKQSRPSAKKSYLKNLLGAIRRYAGSSVPDANVIVEYHGERKTLESDVDGIIECTFSAPQNIPPQEEDRVCFSLVREEGLKPEQEKSCAEVIRYPANHPVGVISDIDDTILISHATKTGKKFWLSISKNAYTRRPFPGVSDFYKALSNDGENPVFYVSSSDWNLFDMIKDFLAYRQIPSGPLLLKDLHVDLKNIWKSGGGSHIHKAEKIELLMELYPKMKFILVGDSGQHDPEIYAEILQKFPGRTLAVYIREIKPAGKQRRELLRAKINDPEAPDITFVQHTEEMIRHAQTHNLIPKS